MDTKLYTVKVMANRERSVSERLKSELLRNEVHAEIFMPSEKTYYAKDGKKTFREKITFPGYIFVESDSRGILEEILKSVPGNSGILKTPKGDPSLMTQRDIDKIKADKDKVEEVFDFHNYVVGESIKVIGGPFDKFTGVISELDKEKKKAKVNVSIFGRSTPVDLQFEQLEKIIG